MSHLKLFICLLILIALIGLGCCTDKTASQEEKNKETLRYVFEEGVNKKNLDVFKEYLTEDFTRHSQAMPDGMKEIKGIEMMLQFLKPHFDAFPDWNEEIIMMVAEGDKIALISRGTGTHTGQMGPFAPTNKSVSIDNYIIQRFVDGKIAETWISWDNVHFMTQLGLMPAAAAGETEKE